jgi:hypothetical protein
MNKTNIKTNNIIDSVLHIRASGSIEDISSDLESQPTKTIAQLLDEKTTKTDEDKISE